MPDIKKYCKISGGSLIMHTVELDHKVDHCTFNTGQSTPNLFIIDNYLIIRYTMKFDIRSSKKCPFFKVWTKIHRTITGLSMPDIRCNFIPHEMRWKLAGLDRISGSTLCSNYCEYYRMSGRNETKP